ncbi:hypothetical protein GCM10027073_41880 [Streptomyces chlorus]
MKFVRALALIGATSASAIVFAAPQAEAASYNGCTYPRVCFYLTINDWNAGRPTASYQVPTSGYQSLGSGSYNADIVWNTRNDDRVSIRNTFAGSTTYTCIAPNSGLQFSRDITVTGVRIEDPASC